MGNVPLGEELDSTPRQRQKNQSKQNTAGAKAEREQDSRRNGRVIENLDRGSCIAKNASLDQHKGGKQQQSSRHRQAVERRLVPVAQVKVIIRFSGSHGECHDRFLGQWSRSRLRW